MTPSTNAAPPKIRVDEVTFSRIQTRTRFPFRYGIASMTEVPHIFVRIRITVDDKSTARGITSEGLPPKWFTKSPDTVFEDHDLLEMLGVLGHAAGILRRASNGTFFEIWQELYDSQTAWAKQRELPPLLANLGVALMERALLDALCRALQQPAWQAVRDNALGILPAAVDSQLEGVEIHQALPETPLKRIVARHTGGLGDPLTDADIPSDERISDGLPHSLESCICTYGLRHFKVKICGDPTTDIPRLQTIAALLEKHAPPTFEITLDGNEQFQDLEIFREQWELMRTDSDIRQLCSHLRFVEQPLHRNAALDSSIADVLARWSDAPAFIIDESDADLDSLPQALALGYSGTSHKNCKGITKSLINAARLTAHRHETGRKTILSGEDLANIGPVALLQDLAMAAMLGIDSVERNGHHYFSGLSMFPDDAQQTVIDCHPDVYHWHSKRFAALSIHDGQLNLDSINRAPFGTAIDPGMNFNAVAFDPVSDWQ